MTTITLRGTRRATGSKKTSSAKEKAPTQESNGFPGKRLLDALWVEMGRREEKTRDLAAALGVAYPYLMSLARGEASITTVERVVLNNAANYLDIPVAQAFILAGALREEDFFHEKTLRHELDNAYHLMQSHPDWCGYAPSVANWNSMPTKMRLFIGLLFDKATSGNLITRQDDLSGEASAVTEASPDFSGKRLLDLLTSEMTRRKERTQDLAAALGIAYPYLMALMRQDRAVPNVSREILESAAHYLNIPVAQAFLLSGALKEADFFHQKRLPDEINALFAAMRSHADWADWAPDAETWQSLPDRVKLFTGMLFERATGTSIFTYAELEIAPPSAA